MSLDNAFDGVVVVDKPPGWTSHDVVNKMRRIASTKKVGHLGTLDPMATGVLPLVVGRATRLAQFYTKADKVYDGVIRFGLATDTYDAHGTPTGPVLPCSFTPEDLERELGRFRGTFAQTPPPISAKKIAGVPAYKLARKSIDVVIPPVEVTVSSLTILDAGPGELRVEIACSAGTYMRSIAHELGAALGCGGHLASLRRLRSGDFRIEQAHTIEALEALREQDRLEEAILRPATLLPQFPSEIVDALTASQIRQGRDFRVSPFRAAKGAPFVKAVTSEGDLVAIGEAVLPNIYHPAVVL